MTLHAWTVFLVAVILLCGTPGPNMLHVMTRSMTFGARRSLAAMAGCLTALVLVLAASAAGVAALLTAWPRVFDALRYAGVAYLIVLGIKAWRSAGGPVDLGADTLPRTMSAARLFRGGFVIGISNPKLLLFAAAFLPQFVNRAAPQGPQFAILVVTFAVVESLWYAVYAMSGRTLARHLTRPALRRAFDRATGAVFVGFGLALLGTRV
ncbi:MULTISPECIES: LysE family translocator [unclassified Sphingomonas]|jgi:threonine/homoserine/homoserine lactone efflux protein|uniref:LysE family translocator n=1 Tax=unclassified Sphingomonas TaxID=196159 RepID=UPI000538B3E6|nr:MULTISPECIES: LysE family translocator [unclassified Sphingomonas]KHA65498.1 amino acid transporter [Sphingomonas sp. Ant20]MBD8470340.1 LysE family translocator [Sphingomonas sp. CFBP 8765]